MYRNIYKLNSGSQGKKLEIYLIGHSVRVNYLIKFRQGCTEICQSRPSPLGRLYRLIKKRNEGDKDFRHLLFQ